MLFLLLSLLSLPAKADLPPLLRCQMENAPITSAEAYSYGGRLLLLTLSEAGWESRVLSPDELDKKLIYLEKKPERTGVLYLRDGEWEFRFKSSDGWIMSGTAECFGPAS